MELYSGRMSLCTESDGAVSKMKCAGVTMREATKLRGTMEDDWVPSAALAMVLVPRTWVSTRLNFNDAFNMARSMISIAIPYSVGWTHVANDIMHIDVHETTGGLVRDFKRVVSIWPLVLCLFVMHVVVYNFLIAVLISSIRELNGHAYSTTMQRSWQATYRLLRRSSPGQPQPVDMQGSCRGELRFVLLVLSRFSRVSEP